MRQPAGNGSGNRHSRQTGRQSARDWQQAEQTQAEAQGHKASAGQAAIARTWME